MENSAYVGQTFFQQTTAFRKAVISWSGMIAGDLADKPVEEWPNEDINWMWDCHEGYVDASSTDCEGIKGHPQKWRSLKIAWRIVIAHRHKVVRLAKNLMAAAAQ